MEDLGGSTWGDLRGTLFGPLYVIFPFYVKRFFFIMNPLWSDHGAIMQLVVFKTRLVLHSPGGPGGHSHGAAKRFSRIP